MKKNAPYEIQLVLMDILDENSLKNTMEETEEYLKNLVERYSAVGISYAIHRVGKGKENWGSIMMPDKKGFTGLITTKRYGQVFSLNFIDYCEFQMRKTFC